jgi:hypothetical protein
MFGDEEYPGDPRVTPNGGFCLIDNVAQQIIDTV